MTIQLWEHVKSQALSGGESASGERVWFARGSNDGKAVYDAVKGVAPTLWEGYQRGAIHVRPEGDSLWECRVEYKPPSLINWKGEPGEGGQAPETTIQFDLSTDSAHMEVSKGTTSYGEYTDYERQIGVSEDGSVQGVDYLVPSFKFSETYVVPANLVTYAFVKSVQDKAATVNDAMFRQFPKGEVLFIGLSGSRRNLGDWELTYQFARNPNVNLEVFINGQKVVVAKEGWEYVWFERNIVVKNDRRVRTIKGVHVEKIYDYSNFENIFPGV